MNKIVILFPGSFKPFHMGHLILLHKYIKYAIENYNESYNRPAIDVKIIISKKDREFINAQSTVNFLNDIKKYLVSDYSYWYGQTNKKYIPYANTNVDFYITECDSPIQECYRIVNESKARETKFMLVTSNKSFDLNRQHEMVMAFNYAGKYFKGFNKILKTNPATVAQVHVHGKCLNATYLRDCVKLDAMTGFIECYDGNIEREILEKYYKNLKALK